jgi:hypothetical protein
MTLTKNKMVREIGRRTRLKNHDVQAMLETLVDVWTEELVSGGRIELENFIVLEVQQINRGNNSGILRNRADFYSAPRIIRQITIRTSKFIRQKLNKSAD